MSIKGKLPLCIDLDGTLIRSDVLHESILLFIKRYPWKSFKILGWLLKGRAFLKERLAEKVMIDPTLLPYNESFLTYIKKVKEKGRDLYLVTAADQKYARIIYDHLKIFKDFFASDGQKNLRASTKSQALCKKFGPQGFIYAGNSRHDLPVWEKSAEIIAVNTPRSVLKKAQAFKRKISIFQEKNPKIKELLVELQPYSWFDNFWVLAPGLFMESSMNSGKWIQCALGAISFLLLAASGSIVDKLFHLQEARMNNNMRTAPISSSRLTIVKATYLSLILMIFALLIGVLVSFHFVFLLMLFFIVSLIFMLSLGEGKKVKQLRMVTFALIKIYAGYLIMKSSLF